ncbi:EAL domain-containing protein [Myxococcota bacterium]|nr:EAL domain-containing protein [Myxococcota bacterium]
MDSSLRRSLLAPILLLSCLSLGLTAVEASRQWGLIRETGALLHYSNRPTGIPHLMNWLKGDGHSSEFPLTSPRLVLAPVIREPLLRAAASRRLAGVAAGELMQTIEWTHGKAGDRNLEENLGTGVSAEALTQLVSDGGPGSYPGRSEDPSDLYAAFREATEKAREFSRRSRESEALASLETAEALFHDALAPNLARVTENSLRELRHELRTIRNRATSLLLITLTLMLTAAAGALLAPAWISHRLTRPIERMTRTLRGSRNNGALRKAVLKKVGSNLDELQALENAVRDAGTNWNSHGRAGPALPAHSSTRNLPERQHFEACLQDTLSRFRADDGDIALLSILLEPLGSLSSTEGGDWQQSVAQQTARRVSRCIRPTDVVTDALAASCDAQISNREEHGFSLLLSGLREPLDAGRVASRLARELSQPFDVAGESHLFRPSIGIAIPPLDGEDAATLLEHADESARSLHSENPSRHRFFCAAMDARYARGIQIASRLQGAIERNELSVHFQPIRDCRSSAVSAAEALLRWDDGELGPVPPSEFIPIAKEVGLMGDLGHWVLEQVCSLAVHWREAGFRPIRLSVNVSPNELRSDDWLTNLERILSESGAGADQIEIEITGGHPVRSDEEIGGILEGLGELGIGVALDDVGPEYAALNADGALPVHRIKLKHELVSSITTPDDESPVLTSILSMAKGLGHAVVAKGINSLEQAEFLSRHGCGEMQGHLISPALNTIQLERFLEREKEPDSPSR